MSSEFAPQPQEKWTIAEFFKQMLEEVPDFAPIYDEHIADNDELLSHMLMEDYFRFIEEIIQNSEGPEVPDDRIVKMLAVIEEGQINGDEDVDNVIGVSFLENLVYGKDTKAYSVLVPKLGEHTLKELRKMENWDSLGSRIRRWFGRMISQN